MKTLRISDEAHAKLTGLLGTLVAQTGKMQTYTDTIEAMLNQSVILPSELLVQIERFIRENKNLGYTTREEFIREAARWRLKFLKKESVYLEFPKERYDRLDAVLKKTSTLHRTALDFIHEQVEQVLREYDDGLTKKDKK